VPQRATSTSFKRGQSGNPRGRPRLHASNRDIVRLAQAYTDEALAALVAALKSPKERVYAACAILNYGWGKPSVAIHVNADVTYHDDAGIDRPPPETVDQWIDRRRKELAELAATARKPPPSVVDVVVEEPPTVPPRPDTVWTNEQERHWQEQEAQREQRAPGLPGPIGMADPRRRW
jgi:hypothetical protein